MTARPQNRAFVGALAAGAALLAGCVEIGIPADGDKPHAELNPIQGMHATPVFKDQELQIGFDPQTRLWLPRGMRLPPAETIAENWRVYPARSIERAEDLEVAAKNPLTPTADSLSYGQIMYETNCVVCHGPRGLGNGYAVGKGKVNRPPSLVSEKLRNRWSDGQIYHVITNGQNTMWPYKNNLYPLERWAVVNYVRALQRAEYPEPQDLDRLRD